jgi:cation:H+ antiporter
VYSGTKLSEYGDIIAEKSGLGKTWIGVVLMASVTSLPELVTGLSSVTYAGVPDIAAGDVLGSCVFNMLILAFLDALYRQEPISTKAHQGHVLSAAFGILLLAVMGAGILLGENVPSFGWIGTYTILCIGIYFVSMRIIYAYEKKRIAAFMKEAAEELKYKDVSIRFAALQYGINALVVIIAATFLPKIGAGIAEFTGLGQTFVGNIIIAISTSLPEVVVSVAAVRMDAVDLAIGNLFGSNIFNIFILALDDIFFVKGPLLSFVNPNHVISALSAIGMTAIAVVGLTYRAEKKTRVLSWDSVGILMLYFVDLVVLFMLR